MIAGLLKNAESKINELVDKPDDTQAHRAVVESVICSAIKIASAFEGEAMAGEATQVLRMIYHSDITRRLQAVGITIDEAYAEESDRSAAKVDAELIDQGFARLREIHRRYQADAPATLIAATITPASDEERACAKVLVEVIHRALKRALLMSDASVVRFGTTIAISRMLWDMNVPANDLLHETAEIRFQNATGEFLDELTKFGRVYASGDQDARVAAAEKAANAFNVALRVEAENARSWMTRGTHLMQGASKVIEGRDWSMRMLDAFPESMMKLTKMDSVSTAVSRWQRAIEDFEKTNRIDAGIGASPEWIKCMNAARQLLIENYEFHRVLFSALTGTGTVMVIEKIARLQRMMSGESSDPADDEEEPSGGEGGGGGLCPPSSN